MDGYDVYDAPFYGNGNDDGSASCMMMMGPPSMGMMQHDMMGSGGPGMGMMGPQDGGAWP